MTIKQIVIAAILGATLGAAAATVHARTIPADLEGQFDCEANVWPVGKIPFEGAPEKPMRHYTITVNAAYLTYTAQSGDHSVRLMTADVTKRGLFGTAREWGYAGIDDDDQPIFAYYNKDTSDSVGFFNCVAKRKF